MTKTERLSAKAIMEIISKETGERVGWLYEWNDGKQVPGWCDGPVDDVDYVPITSDRVSWLPTTAPLGDKKG